MRRRRKFDRGKWMIERERRHIHDRRPPPTGPEAVPIGDVMSVALKQLGLEKDVWLHTLENEWVKLVGNTIAKHARPGRYENGMLIVFVDSSVWLNELKRYGKKEMLSKLQERFGARKMRKLVLSPDPDGP